MKDNLKVNDLIITIDNAGSIGKKINDTIDVDYKTVAYFTLRTAIIENIVQHTKIIGITLANFCGDENHQSIVEGINMVENDLGYELPFISSSESNFRMNESAISFTCIGKQKQNKIEKHNNIAIIGKPLVGDEVLANKLDIVSLKEIISLVNSNNVSRVISVGSKGIKAKIKQELGLSVSSDELDLFKSAGPSTCVIVVYESLIELKNMISSPLTIINTVKL